MNHSALDNVNTAHKSCSQMAYYKKKSIAKDMLELDTKWLAQHLYTSFENALLKALTIPHELRILLQRLCLLVYVMVQKKNRLHTELINISVVVTFALRTNVFISRQIFLRKCVGIIMVRVQRSRMAKLTKSDWLSLGALHRGPI